MVTMSIYESKYYRMKTICTLLLFWVVHFPIIGQSMMKETLSQHGSSEFVYANNRSYFLQQSIGQGSVIQTYQANKHQLRQGFLQPVKASLVASGFDTEIEVFAFPNPFDQVINLSFQETLIDVLTISLYHVSGQLVYQEQFDPTENLTLQFNDLPVGSYFLSGQMRSQTFTLKMIKKP